MLFFWLELGKRFHGAFKLMRMDFSTSCNNIVVRRVISQTAYVLRHTARFGRKADVDAELDGLDSRTEGCPADRAHLACVNNYRVPDKGYYNCALMNQYARILAIGYDRTKAHNIDRPLSRGKKRTNGTVTLDLSWQALRMFEDHPFSNVQRDEHPLRDRDSKIDAGSKYSLPNTRSGTRDKGPSKQDDIQLPNNRLYLFQFSGETPEAPLGAALTKGKGAAEMHMDVMDHGLDRSIAKEKKEEKRTRDLKAKKRFEALKNCISFLEHRL
ncbi:hypothetical protein FCULG_00008105 [Fusarium culmorum]|uniref:Uncharacterized protein n=1 Tax=Fusarium culmorum TaxID=5516 RepID=A0A2T4H353_FUSCU|nr:hypothetical protein FCULG_00008105 [Fusarium culmorum]